MAATDLERCSGEILPEISELSEFLGEGLKRGTHCTVDLSQVDHLSIAHLPLEEVRKKLSMLPLQSAPG